MKTILNVILLLAMVASMAVQYNDPDGVRWMFVYGFAAAMCANALRGHHNKILLGIGLLGYIIGAVMLIPDQWDGWITNEIARESGGLFISSLTIVILLIQSFMNPDVAEQSEEVETHESE